PVPEPGPGEVRVAVHAAGICASDREVYDGTRAPGYVRYPIVPGHEWSGTIEAVGEGVDPGLAGRKTVAEGFRACGVCERWCTAGYEETGFTQPGAFADHVVVPARLLHPLPDDADLTAAALLERAAQRLGGPVRRLARTGRTEDEVLAALSGPGSDDVLVCARDGDRSRPGPHTLAPPTRFVVDHAPCPVLLVW
ncbi:alcohol dehydrogenase catalytic domain-containing protein, partial [Vibrio vulnificus]|nr:alcohol dehydrogenase catalytic domain-containing protein [Vibrio vulnificus]